KVFQHFDFSQALDTASIQSRLDALISKKLLTAEELKAIDPGKISRFCSSDLGQRLLAHERCMHRELPFTVRFQASDPIFGTESMEDASDHDFRIVQGVVDLAIILPDVIWIVDFKSDDSSSDGFSERVNNYRRQLHLYGQALNRIYGRRVEHAWLYFIMDGEILDVLSDLQ
ncbi:MAG: hypothetical protein SFY81_12055, partial [Verrucomicrobiota bacterium]|nr:hypothetical protein [Verrucomicrobiota bacterium]